jgi:hypothetical protein
MGLSDPALFFSSWRKAYGTYVEPGIGGIAMTLMPNTPILTAVLAMRPGQRKSDQTPMRNRSAVERFDARCREHVTIISCF